MNVVEIKAKASEVMAEAVIRNAPKEFILGIIELMDALADVSEEVKETVSEEVKAVVPEEAHEQTKEEAPKNKKTADLSEEKPTKAQEPKKNKKPSKISGKTSRIQLDMPAIKAMREAGRSWEWIGEEFNCSAQTVINHYKKTYGV